MRSGSRSDAGPEDRSTLPLCGNADTLADPVGGTEQTLVPPPEVAATLAAGGVGARAPAEAAEPVTREDPGRYVFEGGRVAAELGRGGIGRVLIARDAHLGREIAVKELLGDGPGASGATPAVGSDGRTSTLATRSMAS